MDVQFYFLNVGDGDCTIVHFPPRELQLDQNTKFDERIMMVDIHHHDNHNNYEDVIDYFKTNFPGKSIFRFIATHPQKDHITGIKQLFEDNDIHVWNFWDLQHDFEPSMEGEEWETYKEDWEKYCELRKKEFVKNYWDYHKQIKFWDEDRIEILSPSKELHNLVHYKEDGTKRDAEGIGQLINNMSYVLLIRINNIKILLAADAEEKCWEYILRYHTEEIKNVDILKAPHHGRATGFHEDAVKLMNPKYIVFSMSKETADSEDSAEKNYAKLLPNAQIIKTSDYGSVIAKCDFNGDIKFVKG